MDGKPYEYHEPTQAPIRPPYAAACELKRADKLAKPRREADFAAPETPRNETVPQQQQRPYVTPAVNQHTVGAGGDAPAMTSLAAAAQTDAADELLGAVGGVAAAAAGAELGLDDDESRAIATLCDEEEFVRGISELNVEDD